MIFKEKSGSKDHLNVVQKLQAIEAAVDFMRSKPAVVEEVDEWEGYDEDKD